MLDDLLGMGSVSSAPQTSSSGLAGLDFGSGQPAYGGSIQNDFGFGNQQSDDVDTSSGWANTDIFGSV